MHLGHWQLDSVSGGEFWLDGGVVFGIVPKALWSKVATPDDNNRIRIRSHCVLARDGRHTVLVDTGYGSKFSPLDQRFYNMQSGNPIVESLVSLGVTPEEIDYVVFTHLHFDHAGGATLRNGSRRLVPTFPRARHVIGRTEWEDAVSQRPELQTAYSLDNLTPLADAGQIDFIDGDVEILPGLRSQHTGGHTRGHLSLAFESNDETAFCIGDLCATTAHLHPMWNLSYDTYPLDTRRIKPRLLATAAEQNWWLIWPHDINVGAARLQQHPKRGFSIVDAKQLL